MRRYVKWLKTEHFLATGNEKPEPAVWVTVEIWGYNISSTPHRSNNWFDTVYKGDSFFLSSSRRVRCVGGFQSRIWHGSRYPLFAQLALRYWTRRSATRSEMGIIYTSPKSPLLLSLSITPAHRYQYQDKHIYTTYSPVTNKTFLISGKVIVYLQTVATF